MDNKVFLGKYLHQHLVHNLSFLHPFSTMICLMQQIHEINFDSFLEQQLLVSFYGNSLT